MSQRPEATGRQANSNSQHASPLPLPPSNDRGRILKAADAALSFAPITITKFRAQHSQGGPNDFYSNADYWWPDPAKTNGLPYVQRDGESNPGNFSSIAWRCATCVMPSRRWGQPIN